MRLYLLLGLVITFSCTTNQDGLEISIFESGGHLKDSAVCEFKPRIIGIEIKNKSENSFYLPGVRTGKVNFDDYLPILANYGSPQKDAKARIDKLKLFLDRGKTGEESDKFTITLPVHYKRYQIDSKGNEVDLFHIISELEEIQRTEYIRCNYTDFQIPIPSDTMDLGISDTLWLEPGEVETLFYDVTPFLLRKGTYEFQFFLKSDSMARPVIKKNNTYLPYSETIQSEKLILK